MAFPHDIIMTTAPHQSSLQWGTPLRQDAQRILLLGSGELGREVTLEAMRLGIEVIAADA